MYMWWDAISGLAIMGLYVLGFFACLYALMMAFTIPAERRARAQTAALRMRMLTLLAEQVELRDTRMRERGERS